MTSPSPTAATPILASSLLSLEEKQRRKFTDRGKAERITTGCGELDDLFGGGGVERGIVLGLSCGEGGEAVILSLNLLATILISHLPPSTPQPLQHQASNPDPKPSSTVAHIIDTTGSFPLSLLASILRSRILSSGPAEITSDTSNINDQVTACLDLVSISRVFDIEGLWEVISEISHPTASSPTPSQPEVSPEPGNEVAPDIEIEIPSSSGITLSSPQARSQSPRPELPLPAQPSSPTTTTPSSSLSSIEMILISTLTPPIHTLFTTHEKSTSHVLLALLSRTIHALSTTQNILTVIHNGVVPSNPAPPISDPVAQEQQQQQQRSEREARRDPYHQTQQTQRQTSPSIFQANPTKPALGKIFAQFPTLHLFFHAMPRSRTDAERSDAFHPPPPPPPPHYSHGTITTTTIIEILKDESPPDTQVITKKATPSPSSSSSSFGKREESWTAVDATTDGTGLRAAFEQRGGTMRGLGLERERQKMRRDRVGGMTEQGRFAKAVNPGAGFGGRRV